MATPIAYYDLSSARMLDTIVNHVEYNLLYRLETELRNKIRAALRITDEAHCASLLEEDPRREAQRARLEIERVRLEEALRELEQLPQSSGY